MKLDSQTRAEVVDELVDRLDAETLRDVRLKVFRFAKNKIVDAVTAPRTSEIDPAFDGNVSYGDARKAQQVVDEWTLIARKGLPRIAMDIVDFLNFYGDDNAYFPHKLIKRRKPTRKGKKGAKKPNTRGSKQTLITFTSTAKPSSLESGGEAHGGRRFEKGYGETSESVNEDDASSVGVGTQSDGSESDGSDISEDDRSSEDNIEANEIDPRDDSIFIPPSGRVADDIAPTPYVNAHANADTSVLVSPGEQVENTQAEWPRDSSEQERPKQYDNDMGRSSGDSTHPTQGQASAEAKSNSDESPAQAHVPTTHASKPVVTIVRVPASDNGFWEPQQEHNLSSRARSITMTTQTGWDVWGSPLTNGGRSISPSRRVPECDCKHNVKVLNEWRRESDRRTEANEDKFKAKLNILRAKVIEGEDEREKMRATIASLSKQVAMNTAYIAESKIRAADPSYGPAMQNTRSTSAVNQSSVASNRVNTPLPQRQPNGATKARFSNNGNGGPPSNGRNNALRERSEPNRNNVPTGAPSAQSNAPLRPTESRGNTRPQMKTNEHATLNNSGRPQNGGANTRQGNSGNNPAKRAESMTANKESRPNPTANNDSRGPPPTINRPKSVQVYRANNDPRSSYDLPQNGEISFSWSEDPVPDVEIIAASINPPAPVQKDCGQIFHQNRYDILRDALSDTMQREEAARNAGNSEVDCVALPRSGEKRDCDDYVVGADEKESYLDVAGRYNWEAENKRRRKMSSNDHVPPIYGVKTIPQRDIFVRDLAYSMCNSPEDLESRVKNHCRLRGVVISFIKAFPIKSNCAKANCKITVNLDDVNNVLSESFWPEYVTARPWRLNPPNNAGNDDNASKGLE